MSTQDYSPWLRTTERSRSVLEEVRPRSASWSKGRGTERRILIAALALAISTFALGDLVGRATTGAQVVPTTAVAGEVCSGNGPVERVVLVGSVYQVTCHSGVIEEVQR